MSAPTFDRGELQRRAVSGTLWTAIHVLISLPIAFVGNAVVARILGVAEYGRLAFLTALLVTMGQLLGLGCTDATIQFGAAAHARGQAGEVNSLLRKTLGLQLLQAPLLLAVTIVVLQGSPIYLILAAVVGIAASSTFGTSSMALTVESLIGVGARIAMVANLIVQAAVIAAAILLESAAGVWAIRTSAVGLLVALCLFPLSASRRRAALSPAFPRRFPAGYWRFAASVGGATLIATLVFTRSEIFLLQWLSTPAAVGLFALAYGIGIQLTSLAGVLLGPLIPTIAGLVATEPEAVARAYQRVLGASSVFVGFLTAVLLPPVFVLIPVIYGSEYAEVSPLLVALGLTAFLAMLANPTYAFVVARLKGLALVRLYLIALAVDVALAVPLILVWGVWGAVVANAGGVVVACALLVSNQLQSQKSGWDAIVAPLRTWLAAAGVAILVVAVSALSPIDEIPTAALATAAGFAGWILSLRLVGGGLYAADMQALYAALPARMSRAIEPGLRWLIPVRSYVGDGPEA